MDDDRVTLIANKSEDTEIVLGEFSGKWGKENFALSAAVFARTNDRHPVRRPELHCVAQPQAADRPWHIDWSFTL